MGTQWSSRWRGSSRGGRAHGQLWPPQVVGNCRKLGAPKVFFIAADMASPEVPERVVRFALDKLGEGRGLDSGTGASASPGRTRKGWGRGSRWAEVYGSGAWLGGGAPLPPGGGTLDWALLDQGRSLAGSRE